MNLQLQAALAGQDKDWLAKRAEFLLNDPLLDHVFKKLAKEYLNQIISSPSDRVDQREEYYMRYQVLQELKGELSSLITSAKLAIRHRS